MPARWSDILRRVTTAGPHINERLSIVVLTSVIVAAIGAVAYADRSVTSLSFTSLYFLPLALSALVHPLRISLALSFVCLALHDFLNPVFVVILAPAWMAFMVLRRDVALTRDVALG
jgi:hypothetical protein